MAAVTVATDVHPGESAALDAYSNIHIEKAL
jgi:hypothetical protein